MVSAPEQRVHSPEGQTNPHHRTKNHDLATPDLAQFSRVLSGCCFKEGVFVLRYPGVDRIWKCPHKILQECGSV